MNTPMIDQNEKRLGGGLLLSLVLALIFILVVLMPLEPSDYWTYQRIGQEILRAGNIPTTEFMTYTSGGNPAFFAYWLPSILFLKIYEIGGLAFTALVTGLCVTAFYALLSKCLKELNIPPVTATLVVFVTALMGSNNWSTRPQIFAYPLFALTVWLLLRARTRSWRGLMWIPLIAVLWVNVHGSFILLFVLLVSALIFGAALRKPLLLVTLASLAATLVNPYGLDLWAHTAGMVGSDLIKTVSTEWFPPVNQGWQLNLFFGSLLVVPVLAAFSPARAQRLSWIWFLGFGWMALSGIRYVIWFTFVEALLVAQLAVPWLGACLDRRELFQQKTFNLILSLVLWGFALTFLPGIRQSWWREAPPELTDTTPVEAVGWLAEHPELPDHLWANWVASIYMSYALPEREVWITNRIEDFPEAQHLDNQRLMRAAYDWPEILEKYGVNTLLLDRTREQPLIQAVERSGDWREIYRDDHSLIFERTN